MAHAFVAGNHLTACTAGKARSRQYLRCLQRLNAELLALCDALGVQVLHRVSHLLCNARD